MTSLVAVVVLSTVMIGSASAATTDPDRDGLTSAYERDWTRTDPSRKDTDRDGTPDGSEDPDADRLINKQEATTGTRPRRADTDRDGLRDDRENADGDALWNWSEFRAGTHPRRGDSDRDGLGDGKEDPDRDGLSNATEQRVGTHPRRADTDGDGYSDAAERSAGTNPLDPASHPTPAPGTAPTLPGAPACPVFPADNVWNVRVDGRSVAANSATMISAIGLDRGLHMDFGSYAGYGIPYQVVTAATPRSTVAFEYADESDQVMYPIPASPSIEGAGAGGDRHILMVDKDACRLYELFAAEKVGSQWTAGSGATWDLRSNALRAAGWTSADAAGLPILPGLVRYDEVAAGAITHALRFTTNQTKRAYVYPARHYASSSTSTSLPPMGMRVRLKASYDTSALSPHARAIAVALQRYGMILADNGSPWYVSGMSDPRFDDDVLHELDVITGRDLEVVDTSGLVNGP
ncbi:MAG: hypothetical protein ACSLFN_05090 [Candidatus Limnocylindrales bacterium]